MKKRAPPKIQALIILRLQWEKEHLPQEILVEKTLLVVESGSWMTDLKLDESEQRTRRQRQEHR